MESSKRQTGLLYELLESETLIPASALATRFAVTEKTIRQDVKTINDHFRSEGVEVLLVRGKGYRLEAKEQKTLSELKKQFGYRFIDTNDLATSKFSRHDMVLGKLLTADTYTTLEDLSLLLGLNIRTISTLLIGVRKTLLDYNIELKTKPRHGLYLFGRELDIRSCFVDTVCYYSSSTTSRQDLFEDGLEQFGFMEKNKKEITKKIVSIVCENDIDINLIEIRKFAVLVMVSNRREHLGYSIEFTKEEEEMINSFSLRLGINKLVEAIKDIYHVNPKREEVLLYKLFIIMNLDYKVDRYKLACPPFLRKSAQRKLNGLLRYLREIGVEGRKNNTALAEALEPLVNRVEIRSHFKYVEYNANATLRKAVANSPMSASLGLMCYSWLQGVTKQKLGEKIYIDLSLGIYECIRKTRNIRKMNTIAILSPSDRNEGESLRRRVLDRYSNIIKSIDVVTLKDWLVKDMSVYNHLLYYEEMLPDGIDNQKMHIMKVDYYFTEKDVSGFYEHIAIPSRVYSRCFGELKKNDYCKQYHFTNLMDLKKTIKNRANDSDLRKQIDDLHVSGKLIYNQTLNLILYTKKKESCFSLLLDLEEPQTYHGIKYSRVFIHSVFLDGDMIRMKTAEKVIRNLTCIADTEDNIMADKIDFYEYYINNKYVSIE